MLSIGLLGQVDLGTLNDCHSLMSTDQCSPSLGAGLAGSLQAGTIELPHIEVGWIVWLQLAGNGCLTM
jgi:hypothetical protein